MGPAMLRLLHQQEGEEDVKHAQACHPPPTSAMGGKQTLRDGPCDVRRRGMRNRTGFSLGWCCGVALALVLGACAEASLTNEATVDRAREAEAHLSQVTPGPLQKTMFDRSQLPPLARLAPGGLRVSISVHEETTSFVVDFKPVRHRCRTLNRSSLLMKSSRVPCRNVGELKSTTSASMLIHTTGRHRPSAPCPFRGAVGEIQRDVRGLQHPSRAIAGGRA
jgi:hypothetical protein